MEARTNKKHPTGPKGSFQRVDLDFRRKGEMRNLFVLLASNKQLKLKALYVNAVFKYL